MKDKSKAQLIAELGELRQRISRMEGTEPLPQEGSGTAGGHGAIRSLFETAAEGVCLHELILDQNKNPIDYRIINCGCGEGGTGAAPIEFTNSVGTPLKDALIIDRANHLILLEGI